MSDSHWRPQDEKLNPRQKEAINAMTVTVPQPLPPVLVLGTSPGPPPGRTRPPGRPKRDPPVTLCALRGCLSVGLSLAAAVWCFAATAGCKEYSCGRDYCFKVTWV